MAIQQFDAPFIMLDGGGGDSASAFGSSPRYGYEATYFDPASAAFSYLPQTQDLYGDEDSFLRRSMYPGIVQFDDYADYGWGESGSAPAYDYGDYGWGESAIGDLGGWDSIGNGDVSQMYPGGTPSAAELQGLVNSGYGNLEGLNPNNPTQSAAELLNSYQLHDFLNRNTPTLLSMLSPQLGAVMSAAKSGGDFLTGKTSLEGALLSTAAGLIAKELGVPQTAVTSALKGDFGSAVSSALTGLATNKLAELTGLSPGALTALARGDISGALSGTLLGGLTGGLAKETGIPAALIGMGLKESGLGSTLTSGIGSLFGGSDASTPSTNLAGDFSAWRSSFFPSGAGGDTPAGASGIDGTGVAAGTGGTGGTGSVVGTGGTGSVVGTGGTGGTGGTSTGTPNVPSTTTTPSAGASGIEALIPGLVASAFSQRPKEEEYKLANVGRKSPFGSILDRIGG